MLIHFDNFSQFLAHLVTSTTKKKITVSSAHCCNTKIRVVRHLARLALMVGLQGDKEQMHWQVVSVCMTMLHT